MDKIGIIIGSLTAITEKQVEYLKRTVHSGTLNIENCPDIKLFYLPETDFSTIKDMDFISLLIECRGLIMSGGETAFSVLDASGFNYLESGEQILPLISTGIIHGGMLDGKRYVIKGGSLGDDDIYIKLIQHLSINTMEK